MDKYSALYESNPDINILDKSATGSGKTTQALQHIDYLVAHGKCAIMVMQSYNLLEEAFQRLDVDSKDNAIIFKGKTQEDKCPRHDELKELYKYIITGLCPECNKKANCEYYKQIDWIKDKRKEDKGICVFTVKENVPVALSIIDSKDVTIIVDDISISNLVEPTDIIPVDNLQRIDDYLSEKKREGAFEEYYILLQEIVGYLLSDSSDIQALKDDYQRFGDVFHTERDDLTTLIIKKLWEENLPDFKPLYKIIKRLEDNRPFLKKRNKKTVSYTEDNTDFYKDYRILYLNATPASLETKETTPDNVFGIRSLFEQLGEYHLFNEPPPPNENWVILQVDSHKFSKNTMSNSKLVRECIMEIIALNDGISKYLGIDCLLITLRDVYAKGEFGKAIRGSGYAHKHVYYFGDGARSTNKHIDSNLCICAGTPYPNPDFYNKPRYNQVRCNNGIYNVGESIINTDANNEAQQSMDRVLRGNPEINKLGIFFGKGEFSTNGAVVRNGYDIHSEKKRTRFLNKVKVELRRIYRQPLTERLTERLCREVEIRLNEEGRVKLDSYAREFVEIHNLGMLYTPKTITNYIKENFDIEVINENRTKVAYIISKNCSFPVN